GILAALGIGIGFILFIVPGLFLLTIWSMLVPVIVIEGRAAGESFSRSREIVRGHGWPVFGLILITFITIGIASALIRLVFSPIHCATARAGRDEPLAPRPEAARDMARVLDDGDVRPGHGRDMARVLDDGDVRPGHGRELSCRR